VRATFRHTPSKADTSGRRDRQAVELNGLGPAVSALVSFTLVRQRPYGLKARLSTTTRWLRADQPNAEGTRNPIRYEDSPFDLGACRCGCGAETKSLFLPGHDQRAIHARIAQVGSVAAFLKWFDETWSGE